MFRISGTSQRTRVQVFMSPRRVVNPKHQFCQAKMQNGYYATLFASYNNITDNCEMKIIFALKLFLVMKAVRGSYWKNLNFRDIKSSQPVVFMIILCKF